jgi:hypothetical protein
MENENLLDTVVLPSIDRENFYNSKPYKTLKDVGGDTSLLEGYEEKSTTPVTFDAYIEQGGTKEDWIAKHVTEENKKMFFDAIGDFALDLGKDGLRSLAVGTTNGVDFAVNLAPVLTKLYDLSPIGTPPGTLEASGFQEDFVAKANAASEKLGEAREFLKNYKDDGNVVSKLVQVMGQDMMYSIPIYNKLKSIGIPTVPAFVISGGIGGAIGIEKNLKITGDDQEQFNSTFTQDFFGKDIAEFKKLVGILPNTPYDEIADEVTQALEYGAFSYAIPKVIQGFQFMKKNIPYFAGGAAAVTMTGDDAEASPIKAIANAVFKSSVRDAAEKKITSGSGQQILNTIQNTPGVKSSEIKWIGLDTFLKDKKKVTQEEVLKFIEDNRIDVTEVMFPTKGKDFGMFNDMLKSIETRKQNFIDANRDIINQRGGIDFDNFALSTKERPQGSAQRELVSFTSLDINPVGKLIRGFDDPNTFEVDVDAIKKQYKADENSVDFYIVEDIERGDSLAISKTQFEDPEFNPIIKNDEGKEVGPKYELEFINNMENYQLEKFALEHTSRSIRSLRAKQQGSTRYETYTEPGGEDYKELIFKFKQRKGGGEDRAIPIETRVTRAGNTDEYGIEESPHFKELGEIAHVRFKTREIDRGMKKVPLKVLSVEEMQSDLVQAVKKSNKDLIEDGTPNLETGEVERMDAMDYVITDFPFKNNWYELTLKRLIRYAADNGFDAISIPKGSVIQDRYQITKRIDDFEIGSFDPVRKEVGLEAKDQNGVLQISDLYTFDRVEKEFGKDVLDRIIKKGKSMKQADYDDYNNAVELPKTIEIGGEGKNQLYNKTIPAFLKKYGKKWNAKVYDDNLRQRKEIDSAFNQPNLPVTIIEITPEMKQSVQETPQALFSYFGGTVLGYEMVKDSIQNNIISQPTN